MNLDDIMKEPYLDSRRLAEVLGRRHDNVLKTIRKQSERVAAVLENITEGDSALQPYLPFILHANPEFLLEEEILSSNGRPQPYYRLNRDAVLTVIAQLQGKQALVRILAYSKSFELAKRKEVPQ